MLHRAADGIAAALGLLLHGDQGPVRKTAADGEAAVLAGCIAGIVRVPLRDDGGSDAAFKAQRAGAGEAGKLQAGRRKLGTAEAHKPGHRDPKLGTALCLPCKAAAERTSAHVQYALMIAYMTGAEVEPFSVGI